MLPCSDNGPGWHVCGVGGGGGGTLPRFDVNGGGLGVGEQLRQPAGAWTHHPHRETTPAHPLPHRSQHSPGMCPTLVVCIIHLNFIIIFVIRF